MCPCITLLLHNTLSYSGTAIGTWAGDASLFFQSFLFRLFQLFSVCTRQRLWLSSSQWAGLWNFLSILPSVTTTTALAQPRKRLKPGARARTLAQFRTDSATSPASSIDGPLRYLTSRSYRAFFNKCGRLSTSCGHVEPLG